MGERQVDNCVNTLMQNDGKCLTNQQLKALITVAFYGSNYSGYNYTILSFKFSVTSKSILG